MEIFTHSLGDLPTGVAEHALKIAADKRLVPRDYFWDGNVLIVNGDISDEFPAEIRCSQIDEKMWSESYVKYHGEGSFR